MSTFKIEKPIICWCGKEITEFTVGYGRTPYGIFCKECKTSLKDYFPSGVGWHLYSKHAIQGYKDMCKATEYLRMRGIEATPQRLAEYWYREFKNLGHNPAIVNYDYFPSKRKVEIIK